MPGLQLGESLADRKRRPVPRDLSVPGATAPAPVNVTPATHRRPMRRILTSSTVLLVLVCGCAAKDASPDARIRYYQARVGGPTTYPSYARLGLAYAEKARASGRTSYYLEAARHLERSLAFQRNYEALLALSGVSLALHHFPEALASAREPADTVPGDPATQGALFDALLGSGDYHAAERVLAGFETKDGFGRLVRWAALLEYRGQTEGALQAIEQG